MEHKLLTFILTCQVSEVVNVRGQLFSQDDWWGNSLIFKNSFHKIPFHKKKSTKKTLWTVGTIPCQFQSHNIGGSKGGGVPLAHAPQQDPILLFLHTFSPKSTPQ